MSGEGSSIVGWIWSECENVVRFFKVKTGNHAMTQSTNPVAVFERTISFQLFDREHLTEEQQATVAAALVAHNASEDTKIHAGAAAMAHDGTIVSTHNDIPGSFGHAEQRVVSLLYATLPLGHKKLERIALAVTLAGEEMVREHKYDAFVSFFALRPSLPCGKCLEYISDVTANVDDFEFLLILPSGQVIMTSLRSLFPWPYVSVQVAYDPDRCCPMYRETSIADQKR